MLKSILIFTTGFLFSIGLYAQKKDAKAFYMDSRGEIADSTSPAVYVRYIFPKESNDLYPVKDYYINGKPKLIANSTSDKKMVEQGTVVEYYTNGNRKSIANYEKGKLLGDDTRFYPNGKPYCLLKHIMIGKPGRYGFFATNLQLIECRDSTGKVLAENGTGNWLKFDDDLKLICQGPVANSKEEGEWKGVDSTGVERKGLFKKGEFVSGDLPAIIDDRIYYYGLEKDPMFGTEEMDFIKYLIKTVRYPAVARERNIQGKIIVAFIVEKDGTLSVIRIENGLPGGISEEGYRVFSKSPKWNPGLKYGLPVRTHFRAPLSFALASD